MLLIGYLVMTRAQVHIKAHGPAKLVPETLLSDCCTLFQNSHILPIYYRIRGDLVLNTQS
jgi:hypothetical protein